MRRSFLLVWALVGAGCFKGPPPALPEPIGRRLVLGDPRGPNVILEADWTRRGSGRFCARGTVDVITPAGPIGLHDADLCATPWPASISGEAQVPLPAIGFLVGLVTQTSPPRGRLSLSLGREVKTLAIGQERWPAEPDRYYLNVDVGGGGRDVDLGRGRLTLGDRMIIDVQAPVLYLAADLMGLLPAPLRGVVIGLAPTGGLPWRSAHELYDGRDTAPRELVGHMFIQGTIPLGDYPVTLTGRLVVDLDADDDGRTVFTDDGDDLAFGADGVVRLAYTSGGFDLRFELARASVLRQGGALHLGATAPGSLLAATPLAAFAPEGDLTVLGSYRSAGDFVMLLRGQGRLAGLPFSNAELAFGPGGVAVSGRLHLGSPGPVDVAGVLHADGSFALRAASNVGLAGLPISSVEVLVSSQGARVSGTVRFAGTSFQVTGIVEPGREIALQGTIPLNLSPVFGRAILSISTAGLSAVFQGRVCASGVCVQLPDTVVDTSGRVCPSFPLVGRQCVKVL